MQLARPTRREALATAGLGLTGLASFTASAVAGDADPRPAPDAGTKPNRNVPETQVDPLPCDWDNQNAVAPVGDWIAHSGGWRSFPSRKQKLYFLNHTEQTFVIDGETFVLDEASDWDLSGPGAEFRYTTPPKRKQTYGFSWDAVATGGASFPILNSFPFEQVIHIVDRDQADTDCL